ncbi:MAG: anti-sigma factor family protein, partial [Streptomyces sp.]|uniref:anti-sigma factor family protein n=1 Tax=Streptomyces sp. TaxID=1931 RepID=UPI003D6A2322
MSADPYREWDSAYVLGALSVPERLQFERHLEVCQVCVRSVNDLAGMPGILGRLSIDDALAVRNRSDEKATLHELDGARVLRGLARQ